jgi:hypothetical protein
METYCIKDWVDNQVTQFMDKIKQDGCQVVIEDRGDYYILRRVYGGYNFVSLTTKDAFYKDNRDDIKDVMRGLLMAGRSILLFNNFIELCEWYLKEASIYFRKYNYEFVKTPVK